MEVLPGEHVAANGSLTETETQAAGPMLCQIQRDSCAFQQLVIDQDPTVLFSDYPAPPYGLENRMMHPAMQLPLARLAALVRGEWDGRAQLMVTAAYDSQFRHDLAEPNTPQFAPTACAPFVVPWHPSAIPISRRSTRLPGMRAALIAGN